MIFKNQKVLMSMLGLFLLASVAGDILLYQRMRKNESLSTSLSATPSCTVFEGFGFNNEAVIFFDGSQYRTYATSSPLKESDVRVMREDMKKEFERMNEFFRRQDELFQYLWNF